MKKITSIAPDLTSTLLLLTALVSFTPLRLFSFIALLYIIARIIPLQKFGGLSKFVLGYLILFCTTACLASVFWVLNWPLTSGIVLGTHYAGLFLLYLSTKRAFKPLLVRPKLRLQFSEVLSAGFAILATSIVLYPVVIAPNAGKLGAVIMAGGDNYAHIEMVKGNDLNHGYVLVRHENRFNLNDNYLFYPQGWHLHTAFTKWTTETAISMDKQPGRFLLFYYITACSWFAILLFLAARLYTQLAESLKIGRLPLSLGLLVIGSGTCLWLIPLFISGFHTQIVALSLLLACVSLLCMLSTSKNPYMLLLLAGLLVAGTSFAWVFLAPIALGIFFIMLCLTLRKTPGRPPFYFYLTAPVIALFVFVQPLVQMLFGPKTTNNSFVNQPGYIPETSMFTLLFIFILLSTYLFVRFKSSSIRTVYGASILALTFSLVLFQYQISTVHELRYYYFKSTYTFIVLALVLGAVVFADMIQIMRNEARVNRSSIYISVSVILLGGMVMWQTKNPLVEQFFQSKLLGIGTHQASIIADIVSKDPTNGLYVVSIGSCNRGDDIRATGFAHALAYTASADTPGKGANFQLSIQSKEYLYEAINKHLRVKPDPIIILSNDYIIGTELMASIPSDAADRVTLINLDGDQATETAEQCPERIKTVAPDVLREMKRTAY
jgi:hypothetical protein